MGNRTIRSICKTFRHGLARSFSRFILILVMSLNIGKLECNAGIVSRVAQNIFQFCDELLTGSSWGELEQGSQYRLILWKDIDAELLQKLNDPHYRPVVIPSVKRTRVGYRDNIVTMKGSAKVQEIRVQMPTGHIFKRVIGHPRIGALGVAWLDESSGLLWSALFPEELSYFEASKKCSEISGSAALPSKEEFEILANHFGFNDGFLNQFFKKSLGSEIWSWTHGPPIDGFHTAWTFDDSNGSFNAKITGPFGSPGAARCVIQMFFPENGR